MKRRCEDGEQGFIISLELILIFTILGIGLLVGLVAIRNALFVWWQNKQAQTVWVYDSTSPADGGPFVLGPARDFDEHEAPRLFYIDREIPWAPSGGTFNFRAFIGVRNDRFTSRHRIFYTQSGCTGVPCITGASDEDADSASIGFFTATGTDSGTDTFTVSVPFPLQQAGGQGYLYALQQGPSYGIGADEHVDSGGFPGTLYRQTLDNCEDPNNIGTNPGERPNAETILSVWTSQQVVSGPACAELTAELIIGGSNCPQGGTQPGYGEACTPQNNTSSNCQAAFLCAGGDTDGLPCEDDTQCAANFYCSSANPPSCCVSQGGPGCFSDGTCNNNNNSDLKCQCPGWGTTTPSDDWVAFGSNCCPPGSEPQSGAGGVGVVCNATTENFLFRADRVDRFYNMNFQPPFRVNLPPDPAQFNLVPPGGYEGAPPDFANATPYVPGQEVNFNVPPSSDETGPP